LPISGHGAVSAAIRHPPRHGRRGGGSRNRCDQAILRKLIPPCPICCTCRSGYDRQSLTLKPQTTGPEADMPITPQEALQRTIEHREIFHDEVLKVVRMI